MKGTQTISDYLRTIKSKADELALLGKPMDPEDLTERILDGLSDDYKPEIDAINGRDTTIPFAELHERLLNREAMLMCKEPSVPGPIVAHATDTRTRQPWKQHNNNNSQSRHNNNQQSTQQRFSKPYLGRCQACGIQGHSARYCPEFRIVKGSTQLRRFLRCVLNHHGRLRTAILDGSHKHIKPSCPIHQHGCLIAVPHIT